MHLDHRADKLLKGHASAMTYQAPIDDITLALEAAGGLSNLIASEAIDVVDTDLVMAVIREAGKFAAEELAPLNIVGDREGAVLRDGKVVLPDAWVEVYKHWIEGGWPALPCPPEFGGQGLPHILSTAISEIWSSANLSFALGPLLTQGAVHAIHAKASDQLRKMFLPKLVSGEWAGTMNLTEPHAGSDLGELRAKAEPNGDGTYKISGTKIFISYGDHNLTENIVHLALARLPNAPAGTRGISLFLVPKYQINSDGSLGERNDVFCTGLERKLGIHASPTCVLSYGDNGGAQGYLIGEEHEGLSVMFLMMNAARLGVGIQGVAVAEAATQKAVAYANQRKQGRARGMPAGQISPIVQHPDVRRNLLTMKALTAAARLICYATARELDIASYSRDPALRAQAAHRAALLTPVAKAYSTDVAVEVSSIGIQVHGGMGFIEETGAAQYFRDARILPIYEGTNGIQSIDLVARKLPLDNGAVVRSYITELSETVAKVKSVNALGFGVIAEGIEEANSALATATCWMCKKVESAPDEALAGATPYLQLFGIAAGGAYLARAALRDSYYGNGRPTGLAEVAKFFASNISQQSSGIARIVMGGGAAVLNAPASVLEVS